MYMYIHIICMYVCMYVYIYIYMHTYSNFNSCIHAHMQPVCMHRYSLYACTRTACMHAQVQPSQFICMHTYSLYVCIHTAISSSCMRARLQQHHCMHACTNKDISLQCSHLVLVGTYYVLAVIHVTNTAASLVTCIS